jgi:hypothetical protein
MLLRRVISHFRKQEWTAIGIDFLIVVLGVFVATQVSDWNEARKDRAREQVYIERLRSDFEAIEARTKMAMDVWQSAVDASIRLLNDFDTLDPAKGPVRTEEEIAADLAALGSGRIPATQAPTFIEMLSAGDVALVRDAALRDALLAYDVQAHYSLESYRVLRSVEEPAIIILRDAAELDLSNSDSNIQLPNGGATVSVVNTGVMLRDVRLRNAIKSIGSSAYFHRGNSALHMERAQEVLAALEAQK